MTITSVNAMLRTGNIGCGDGATHPTHGESGGVSPKATGIQISLMGALCFVQGPCLWIGNAGATNKAD